MTGEDHFSAVGNQVLNGRDGSSNPSVIGNVLGIIKWDIQISPDEDFLSLQISSGEVSNALLGHGYNGPNRLGGGAAERSEPGSNVAGEERISNSSGESEAAERSFEKEASRMGGNPVGGRGRGGRGGGDAAQSVGSSS